MAIPQSSSNQLVKLHDGASDIGTPRNPLVVRTGGKATFRALFSDIAPATDKYMLLLHNANTTYDVVIQRIYAKHSNISAVTGVLLKQELRRTSAFTTGTAITPIADDPETDTLPASISADTNSSAVSDVSGGIIDGAIFLTAEEMILAATAFQLNRANLQGQLIYERKDGERGLTLSGTTAANRGIAVKNLTADTAGSVSYVVVFTVELTSGANS
jgi:hypothetical protein